MLERIEDEHNLTICEEFEREKAAGRLETTPFDELWNELGI